MSKLIDVDEAIINFGFEWDDIPPTREEFVLFLKKQSIIDAVPVIRCEDCKYCDISLVLPTGRKMYNCMEGSHDHQTLLKSNDFCSCGERRKDREYIDSERRMTAL